MLVDVRAAGVNFADHMARQGLYDDAPDPPCVIGYEVAGVVEAVGEGVDAPAVGERVMAATRFGGYASKVVVGAGDTVPLPDGPVVRAGRRDPGELRDGVGRPDRVREPARGRARAHPGRRGRRRHRRDPARARYGAEVWGTASPAKHDRIAELGVQHPLDYTRRGWHRGLPPFDLIMDAIGGDSLRRSYGMLRAGGRLVAFGASSVTSSEKRNIARAARQALPMLRGFNLIEQMSASKAVIGLNVLRLWDDRGTLEPWIAPLTELLADGTIQPVVSDEVPFDRAGDAHRILAERRNVGKVVLVP